MPFSSSRHEEAGPMSSGHDHHGHSHGHDHSHDHAGHSHAGHGHHQGAGHVHAPASYGRLFAIGVTLNVGFVAAEVVVGFAGNSLALLADAGHNLSDVFGLLIAWGAVVLGKVQPSERFTYGLRGSSILAALLNSVVLMLGAGAIALAAFQRFGRPEPVPADLVMIVAAIGILVNGATALLFMSGGKGDINMRGAFLHMAADAAVSAGVVVAGLLIRATGWTWLDPVASLAIVAIIIAGTWGILKEALAMALNAVPAGIDPAAVEAHLAGLPGVEAVHDLHIWPMSTTETAMTAHLVMPELTCRDAFLRTAASALQERFSIGHATIQIERNDADCVLEPDDVV
jgi:cobalt-zinc-cadmium efflux system protein